MELQFNLTHHYGPQTNQPIETRKKKKTETARTFSINKIRKTENLDTIQILIRSVTDIS